MARLLDYFNNDFHDISLGKIITFTISSNDAIGEIEEQLEIKQEVRLHADSSGRLFTYYIPVTDNTFNIIGLILSKFDESIYEVENTRVEAQYPGDIRIGNHSNTYSSIIYFYTESQLNEQQINRLNEGLKTTNLYIVIRGVKYMEERLRYATPIAFISHDSKDKELIGRPLAHGLSLRSCFVWYDEYSLKVGDNLRESIEKGIMESKKCILIITPNFLSNPGWTKFEFNSIFTREMLFEEKLVLPVWYNVTPKEVYSYSPNLAGTFALTWPNQKELTEDQYNQEVEKLISKLHLGLLS